jgi:hypothetical protein
MNPKTTQAGMPLRFTADFYNKLVDTVKWAQRQQTLGGAGQHKFRSNATNVFVKNATGSDLPAFSVLELTGKLHAETDFIWNKSLIGDTPTDCSLPVAITQAPSANGELVECVIAGATIAWVRVDSLGDRFASPIPGAYTLGTSFENGMFRILEPLTELGRQRLLVAYHYSITQICDSGSSSVDSSFSDPSDSVCLRIPGVDMDLIPLVDAATVDYVLAIKDGCLVKVALSECVPATIGSSSGSAESGSAVVDPPAPE